MKYLLLFVLLNQLANASDCVRANLATALLTKVIKLVHFDKDKEVGFLVYSVHDDSVFIRNIRVSLDHQGKGVSKALLDRLFARETGVKAVKADLMDSNWLAFDNAYQHTPASLTPFVRCKMAVAFTPMFRGLTHFGFSNVAECGFVGVNAVKVTFKKQLFP